MQIWIIHKYIVLCLQKMIMYTYNLVSVVTEHHRLIWLCNYSPVVCQIHISAISNALLLSLNY